jgi:hypothetical protein
MWVTLATQAFGLVQGYFQNKTEKQAAQTKVEVALKEAEAEVFKRKSLQEGEWDLESMRGSKDSWKDEYLLILFSIPFIMAFIPQAQPYVESGIALITSFPDWYKAGLAVMIAASFGVRSYTKLWKK